MNIGPIDQWETHWNTKPYTSTRLKPKGEQECSFLVFGAKNVAFAKAWISPNTEHIALLIVTYIWPVSLSKGTMKTKSKERNMNKVIYTL
jgi:hypothetical protein